MILFIHDDADYQKVVVDLKINATGMPPIVYGKIPLFMVQVCGTSKSEKTFIVVLRYMYCIIILVTMRHT